MAAGESSLRLARALALLSVGADDADGHALAETLWLANLLPGAAPAAQVSEVQTAPTRLRASVARTPVQSAAPKADSKSDVSPLFVREPTVGSGTSTLRASRVRVPAADALPLAGRIERALRPFMRRYPSRVLTELDAAATARASAERDQITPVFRAQLERWFDVALVIDDSESMAVWSSTAREFKALLARHGAFRQVRLWRLRIAGGRVALHSDAGLDTGAGTLRGEHGRTLVLMLTHGTGCGWDGDLVGKWLRELARRATVALIQMLPRHAWSYTALGDPTERVLSRERAAPNRRLKLRNPLVGTWEDEPLSAAFPVLPLDPAAIADWARFVMAPVRLEHPALWIAADEGDAFEDRTEDGLEPASTEAPAASPLDGRTRVERFGNLASPDAYALLRLLAMAPVTLPVMRLLQRASGAQPSSGPIAEVMLSGLLRRVGTGTSEDEHVYDLEPKVRDWLQGGISGKERRSADAALDPTREELRKFVERRAGRTVKDFTALLLDPSGDEVLPAGPRAFLEVSRRFYRKWGLAPTSIPPRYGAAPTQAVNSTAVDGLSPMGVDKAPFQRELEHTYEDTASLYFNPPGEVKRLGRRLREGDFGALVSQLAPDEFLIGLYENKNQILVATHVSSKARLHELSEAELTPLGFYAMHREAANRGWDRGTPVLAKKATRPMVVVSCVRSYHALARSLVSALEATGRLNVRYDGHLSSEKSFPSTVLQWVEQSDALVVLVGPASAQANHSKVELERAQKLGKPVVAVVVEAGGLPLALASYQAVNVDDDGTLLLLAHLSGRRLESALRRVAQQVVRAIIQKPDSGPPPIRAWVLVAGTGSSRLGNKERRAAEALGAALARSGYGLVTGGWPGVDEAVARRFADEQKRAHPHLDVDKRLTHVVGRGKKPDYAGAVVVVDNKDSEYDESIRRVSCVVLIGGEGGTWEVALRAERAGRSVLPLADTGGDASQFHMRLKSAWETSGKLPSGSVAPKFDASDLIELAKPVPEAVTSLIGILNRLTLSEQTSPANGDGDHAAELPKKKPIKKKAKPASKFINSPAGFPDPFATDWTDHPQRSARSIPCAVNVGLQRYLYDVDGQAVSITIDIDGGPMQISRCSRTGFNGNFAEADGVLLSDSPAGRMPVHLRFDPPLRRVGAHVSAAGRNGLRYRALLNVRCSDDSMSSFSVDGVLSSQRGTAPFAGVEVPTGIGIAEIWFDVVAANNLEQFASVAINNLLWEL